MAFAHNRMPLDSSYADMLASQVCFRGKCLNLALIKKNISSNCHFEYYTRQEGQKNMMKMNSYGTKWLLQVNGRHWTARCQVT